MHMLNTPSAGVLTGHGTNRRIDLYQLRGADVRRTQFIRTLCKVRIYIAL